MNRVGLLVVVVLALVVGVSAALEHHSQRVPVSALALLGGAVALRIGAALLGVRAARRTSARSGSGARLRQRG